MFDIKKLSCILLSYNYIKNNFWDKKFIKSDDIHDLHCEFAWLTCVHLIFFKINITFYQLYSLTLS